MQAILQKIKDIVVTPCLEEEESYAVRSRKLAVIAVAVIVSNALVLGVPATIVSGLYDPSLGAYLIGAGFFQVSITTSIIPYTYLRCTRKLPDWLVDFQIWSAFPIVVIVDLFAHQGSIAILCSICLQLGVILRVRMWQGILLIGMFGNVLNALINDYSEELPGLHDTFYAPQILPVRLMYLIGANVCPIIFFGGGLHMIMMEFVDRADQADAAIAMNLAVADKLRRYDTDGVAEILAANQGKVDEKLLTAFTAIQHNLQEYRPHIPDYVIAATLTATESSSCTEEQDDDDEGGLVVSTSIDEIYSDSASDQILNNNNHPLIEPSTTKQAHRDGGITTSPTVHRTNTTNSSSNSRQLFLSGELPFPKNVHGDVEDIVSSSNITSSRNGTSPSQLSISLHGAPRRNSINTIAEFPAKRTRTTNSRGSTSLNGNEEKKSRQHFYGRATTVFVRFVAHPCGSDGSGNGFVSKGSAVTAMNILSKCVDAGSKLAKAHGGALQYMQGCGLMVSFNAASRVHAHESKACAFALGLKAAVDDMLDATIVMHASIVTTNVLSFFAGNGGQLMLTVLGAFMPQHTAMHHYLSQTVGKEASCVLLSDTVVPTIEMLYEHRLLGGLQFTRKEVSDKTFNSVSQLLTNRTMADDEWLYQVASRDVGDAGRVLGSKVVLAALSGIYASVDADDEEKGVTVNSDVVYRKCVRERIDDCHRSGNEFVFTLIPPVLW